MNCICYYTTLSLGVWNAWIPAFGLFILQLVLMAIFRDAGKRATDTSWYTAKDKVHLRLSFLWQIALLVVSIFIPLKLHTTFFWVGLALFFLAFIGFVAALVAYLQTPLHQTVSRGVYKLSRNPMYFFFTVGMIAASIASASLWLLIATLLLAFETHSIILAEERFCTEKYGDEYVAYKARTPRYFLFF